MRMEHGESSLDEAFDMLSHPVRRRILTDLARENPQDDDELSPDDFVTVDERLNEFLASLRHTHLPKLADSGFIEWDRESGTITRGPRYNQIAPLVELMIAHEDELPDDWP